MCSGNDSRATCKTRAAANANGAGFAEFVEEEHARLTKIARTANMKED
jgi:hypothetical protein